MHLDYNNRLSFYASGSLSWDVSWEYIAKKLVAWLYFIQVHVWDTTAKAVPTSNYLPRSYFSYFELHFGGCGGYATAANFPGLSGAALGLRYGQ